MMMRRRRGTGTIEAQPDGTFRPRLPGKDGKRLSPCATYEAAAGLLDATIYELATASMVMPEGTTLAAFAEGFLQRRERTHADAQNDRSTWRSCIADASWIGWPLASIQPPDVRAWRDDLLVRKAKAGHRHKTTRRRKLSRSRAQNALNLLRTCFGEAVECGLIPTNPVADVKLPRALARTDEPWTYFPADEQAALLTCPDIDEEMRDLYDFALATGMRESELWNQHLVDLHLAQGIAVVRFGGRKRGTKGRRIRRIQLFPRAIAAAERQIARLKKPGRKNPHGVLWPGKGGAQRPDGKGPASWWRDLTAAGIVRMVERGGKRVRVADQRHDGRVPTFHAIRHSCASALVAGWWGRRWTLEEVKAQLGHRSITTTERYAHLAESTLASAARGTVGPEIASGVLVDLPRISPGLAATSRNNSGQDRFPKPLVGRSSRLGGANDSAGLGGTPPTIAGEIVGRSPLAVAGDLGRQILTAVEHGGPDAWRVVTEAAAAIVGLADACAAPAPQAKGGAR